MGDILPFRADYYPVLGQIMSEIDVAGTINNVVDADDSQSKIDVGTFVCLMIHNLLGDVNIRLYNMSGFFEDKALPLLVPWKPGISLDEINDDRAARVLDAIWRSDPQKIFSAIANRVIYIHELDTSIIHGDTTSISFHVVFGVGTTADGVPVAAEVADGNESDKTLNGRWVKTLKSVLGKDIEDFLLYVADSALITTPNLNHIDFISRLPGNFGIEEELKRKALLKDNWDYIGKLSDGKKAAIYHSCEMTGEIDGETYRFIVIQSDKKDKRKLKTLDRAVKRDHTALTKALEELKKRPFACKRDAEIEVDKFIKEYSVKYHITDWGIEEKTERVKREKRGRPKKNEKIQTQTNYYLNGNLQLDDKAYEMDREICGLFVLITSLMNIEKRSSKDILQRYKGQGNVERIFKFIKNPAWVGSFCLNTPSRIAALGYIVLIAAMIYTLWERNIRKALSDSEEEPIEGLNRQKTKRPTTYALQKVMSSILVLLQITNGKVESIWLPKPLKPNQERILQLTGFSKEIYTYTSNV
jgi:transposase